MSKLFGTDGVRGIANTPPMTAENALAIGRAVASLCRRHEGRHRILIGKDTRLSGYMIETALTAGISSMGVDVLLAGPIPTPGIAFLTHSMRADAGIVISASHNPYQDNGIKIFSYDGYKLSNTLEREIEDIVATGKVDEIRPTADHIGKAQRIDDAIGRYIEFCKNTFPDSLSLSGMKIVLDCANGATYKVAPIIFSELGATVITIHDQPDGTNINRACGSLHTNDLASAVRDAGADVGFAFDGDGDRLIAVDNTGTELTGDHTLFLCARGLKEEGVLGSDRVVVTPMSNCGLHAAFTALGIRTLEADVGDRNVLELMQKEGSVLGGEQSGHVIFLNHHTTGDGIVAALQMAAILCRTNRPLSALAADMTVFPQELINVDVPAKPPLEALPDLQAAIQTAEKELNGEGRILIRYSGTQTICRVMVEGPDPATTRRLAETLATTVQQTIT